MTLPVAPMVMPKDLRGQANGKLHASLLDPIDGGEVLHHLAARSWAALRAAAQADGVRVAMGADAYRPYETQERIFRTRYRQVNAWRPGARRWQGAWWVKLPGVAAAAIPGTSNHGWGLAVDVDDATSEALPAVRWLKLYAALYGWSAEIQSEAWHWRAVHGDRLPPAVLAYEAAQVPPAPAPVPPAAPMEDDDMIMARNSNTGEVVLLDGAAVRPLTGAVYGQLIAAGVRQVDVPEPDFNLFVGRG